ncbi:MAG: transposase [Clostridiales bacterium]|jgi:hypothetical protein|nr:transposase [Clostridiales bacterium]
MLGLWRSHADYLLFVKENLRVISLNNPESLFEYETEISKLCVLNLDKLQKIIAPLYSTTGRPSNFQPEIFRSFILMNHMGLTLDNWIFKLNHNQVLRTAIGVTKDNVPCASSHYDFINRLIKIDERPKIKLKKRKPTEKLGKNVKLPNKHPDIVQRLVNKILCGRSFPNRPERILQRVFADVCVQSSVDLDIIPTTLDISGDGTCIETGASHHGVKICDCKSKGVYDCDCNRKFSDPNATWGWDSSKGLYFYGYTGYFLSTYSNKLKVDIPLSIRLVEAKRNDSVSAVVALNEFRELYPNLIIDTFIHDAACDNYATYELLNNWNINAVIALNSTNKGHFTYPEHLSVNDDGIPICPDGHPMVYWGFDNDRCRIKYRCPFALGKISNCKNKCNCSPSNYGRTIYIKPTWDLRLFTKIPRGSELWKEKMNSRTSIERLNNRILNHYGIENSKTRGKKRISFFTTIAAFNIHLDLQLRVLKDKGLFNFRELFFSSAA